MSISQTYFGGLKINNKLRPMVLPMLSCTLYAEYSCQWFLYALHCLILLFLPNFILAFFHELLVFKLSLQVHVEFTDTAFSLSQKQIQALNHKLDISRNQSYKKLIFWVHFWIVNTFWTLIIHSFFLTFFLRHLYEPILQKFD